MNAQLLLDIASISLDDDPQLPAVLAAMQTHATMAVAAAIREFAAVAAGSVGQNGSPPGIV
jgi:hypothetical protein